MSATTSAQAPATSARTIASAIGSGSTSKDERASGRAEISALQRSHHDREERRAAVATKLRLRQEDDEERPAVDRDRDECRAPELERARFTQEGRIHRNGDNRDCQRGWDGESEDGAEQARGRRDGPGPAEHDEARDADGLEGKERAVRSAARDGG
jgi:hypothetical protein